MTEPTKPTMTMGEKATRAAVAPRLSLVQIAPLPVPASQSLPPFLGSPKGVFRQKSKRPRLAQVQAIPPAPDPLGP